MRRFPLVLCLCLFAVSSGLSEAADPAIRAAPRWKVSKANSDKLIWKSDVRFGGALSVTRERILVGELREKAAGVTAFDLSGKRLWESLHPKLPRRINDMGLSILSKPAVDGSRAYYVSNRGELVCVNIEASLHDRDDGPLQDETQTDPGDADYLWKLDMPAQLGVFKRDAGDVGNPICSPLVLGDLVFCVTGHGSSGWNGRQRIPADPNAPSFIAVHKLTGELVWQSNAPGAAVLYSQWASPVAARIRGSEVVIFPGGDGCLYGFAPVSGQQLWKFDCNEPGAVNRHTPGAPADESNWRHSFVSSPVVDGETLYVALAWDFEHRPISPLLAIDLAGAGAAPSLRWKFHDYSGTFTSAAAHQGIVFVVDHESMLVALDAENGREFWRAKLDDDRVLYASPVVHQGRLYAPLFSSITVFDAAREKHCLGRYELDGGEITALVFSDERMFVSSYSDLYVLRLP